MTTAAGFAESLAGATYPFRLTREQAALAEAQGLVVVYGASDDLMEFEGAIEDELGAWDGRTAWVDQRGVVPDAEDDPVENHVRMPAARQIDALWCEEAGYSWTYRTAIPHATFEVTEDGEPYCRGIVFALADLAPGRIGA